MEPEQGAIEGGEEETPGPEPMPDTMGAVPAA
jgi:hypothetical protein